MKTTVLDIEELQQYSSFFKTRLGKFLAGKLFHIIGMDKVNEIHARHCNLRGAAFTSAMLNDPLMNVHYEVHNKEILQKVPSEGAFITVSNHPIGSLDGITLIDLFASIRPDFRVMVNQILAHISAMSDNFISVKPKTDEESADGAIIRSVNGIRASLMQLYNGHPMGFFPAGAMSFYDKKEKMVRDLPWKHNVIRLIKKAGVTVFPVYFDCVNSPMFYKVGNFSWKLRSLFVCREAFNKQGKTLDIYLREPISAEKISSFEDDDALADYLYKETYNINLL